MAKLFLIQTLFLTILWFVFVSGEIKNEKDFKFFIIKDVIPTFHKWARKVNEGNQFAVLMLMNTDQNWKNFRFLPSKPSSTDKSMVQPAAELKDIDNYVAVLPGTIGNEYMHSEQRIYEKYLTNMYEKYIQKYHTPPKAMVLYSWIVPCIEQSCATEGKGCTDHTIKSLQKYVTEKTQVIVAYTTNGSRTSKKHTTCNPTNTKQKLEKTGIDVMKVNYRTEEEAMIENLIKLGRLLQILE